MSRAVFRPFLKGPRVGYAGQEQDGEDLVREVNDRDAFGTMRTLRRIHTGFHDDMTANEAAVAQRFPSVRGVSVRGGSPAPQLPKPAPPKSSAVYVEDKGADALIGAVVGGTVGAVASYVIKPRKGKPCPWWVAAGALLGAGGVAYKRST